MSKAEKETEQLRCEIPFWKDPMVIFRHFTLQYQPTCSHTIWNFVARIVFLSFCLGLIAIPLGGLLALFVAILFGCMTAAAIIMTSSSSSGSSSGSSTTKNQSNKYHVLPYSTIVEPTGYIAPLKERFEESEDMPTKVSEHFVNGGSSAGSVQPYMPNGPSGVVEVDAFPYSGTALPEHTQPTSRNPFMNILLDEMKYNPSRPEAESVNAPVIKQTFDDYFRVQWFSDPTDVFGKNQNQRQFVTQPSTTVPNDQGSFANWLYRIPGKTCKEGGREACLAGTDGGPIPWLNNAS
jgi:hypothetical protein